MINNLKRTIFNCARENSQIPEIALLNLLFFVIAAAGMIGTIFFGTVMLVVALAIMCCLGIYATLFFNDRKGARRILLVLIANCPFLLTISFANIKTLSDVIFVAATFGLAMLCNSFVASRANTMPKTYYQIVDDVPVAMLARTPDVIDAQIVNKRV